MDSEALLICNLVYSVRLSMILHVHTDCLHLKACGNKPTHS
jgi:hypothetical protein